MLNKLNQLLVKIGCRKGQLRQREQGEGDKDTEPDQGIGRLQQEGRGHGSHSSPAAVGTGRPHLLQGWCREECESHVKICIEMSQPIVLHAFYFTLDIAYDAMHV